MYLGLAELRLYPGARYPGVLRATSIHKSPNLQANDRSCRRVEAPEKITPPRWHWLLRRRDEWRSLSASENSSPQLYNNQGEFLTSIGFLSLQLYNYQGGFRTSIGSLSRWQIYSTVYSTNSTKRYTQVYVMKYIRFYSINWCSLCKSRRIYVLRATCCIGEKLMTVRYITRWCSDCQCRKLDLISIITSRGPVQKLPLNVSTILHR